MTPAQLHEQVVSAMGLILKDPQSARYANLRNGIAGSICGEVSLRQNNGRYEAARPFVITPQAVPTISTSPRIAYRDPADPFPELYIRWCASPDELATVGSQVAAADVEPPVPFEEFPDFIGPNAPQEISHGETPAQPNPPPPADRSEAAARTAPSGNAPDEDSFFNAVVRPPKAATRK